MSSSTLGELGEREASLPREELDGRWAILPLEELVGGALMLEELVDEDPFDLGIWSRIFDSRTLNRI